jgi:dihydrofolate reductase
MKYFKAIAAMSRNRVIGQGSRLPWHLPEDFKWFKSVTTGQIVVMGRRTFESIGRPLPNRTTIVLSRSHEAIPGVRIVHCFEEIDPNAELSDVFICGGAEVYRQSLRWCSDLFLTLVKTEAEGDVIFPPFEDRFELAEVLRETDQFTIQHYRNPAPECHRYGLA